MTCKKTMDHFVRLEDFGKLPFSVRLHIFFCKSCRREIKSLKEHFRFFQTTTAFEMKKDFSDIIMQKIFLSQYKYKKEISVSKWISVGSVIFFSIVLFSFSDYLNWMKGYFGGHLDIPVSIVLGLAISIYTLFFIGTHIDELKKIIGYPK